MFSRYLRALVLALVVASAFALPAPGTALAQEEYIVPWLADAEDVSPEYLARIVRAYRVQHGIKPNRNVAAVAFKYPNGQPGVFAVHSAPYSKGGEPPGQPQGHSERRLFKILSSLGIDTDTAKLLHSEREPCVNPGAYCRNMIGRDWKGLEKVTYSYPYGPDKTERVASNRALGQEVRGYYKEIKAGQSVMQPPGGKPGGGAMPDLLSRRLGGIDFSSLELRYVADPKAGGVRYAFRGTPTDAEQDPAVGLQNADQASDAFFVWLSLPRESFWVNLNPNEPDRVIDPVLARSDAGRVLLDADLLLKKSASRLINPDTPLGDQFWDELEALYGERVLDACISYRTWISPQPATVRETGDALYILDAPLTVNMESEFVAGGGCPQEDEAMHERKEEIFRRLILPPVIQAVNTAPEYAPLRRVYLSRVAAEWFRLRSGEKPTALSRFVDSGNIDPWLAPAWNPMDVFNLYMQSIRNGEWKAERKVQSGGQEYTKTLIYGGVDFSGTPRRNVTSSEFKANWPRLAKQVKQSMSQPTVDTQAGGTWVGGGTGTTARLPGEPRPRLQLRMTTPDRRAGVAQLVSYRLRVFNASSSTLRNVQVCDRMSSELGFVRSSQRARVRNGRHCFRIPRLEPAGTARVGVTARVLNGARGQVLNRATASARGVAAGRARRALQVDGTGAGRPGGVTG